MNQQVPPGLSFLPNLSDEAASEIAGLLEALSFAFGEHYFGQIRRHRRATHPQRRDLIDPHWEDDDAGRSF